MADSPEPELTERAAKFLANKMTLASRRVDHLTFSFWMISSIPAARHNESDFLTYACMGDAFFVHVRLLADFLIHQTEKRDFGPNDLVVGWVVPESSAVERLKQHWELASRHVVHFSRERVPVSLDDLKPIEPDAATLRAMANDVLVVMSEFVVMAEKQKIEHADRLRAEYDEARQQLAWSMDHHAGDTYRLTNTGDAKAWNVILTTDATLPLHNVTGGPDLDQGEALTFMASVHKGTRDRTITVTWNSDDQGTPGGTWRYPLPGRPPR